MKCKCFALLTSLLVLSFATAFSQGTAFTYQGMLKHDGFAAYGTYDFYFSAYGSETGGGPVSPSAFVNGVVVSNGLFAVTIDLGSGAFNGAPRWLQIGVKTNASLEPYGLLTPRQPLTPAPYAVYAGNATRANLVPWSGLQSVPAGFTDGIDNDTTYTAGPGLVLSGTLLALNTNYTDARYWTLSGNGGTAAGTHFLGTTDNQALDLRVNNTRALRLEPTAGAPNIVGGSPLNTIISGARGAVIGGGTYNRVDTFGSLSGILGGSNNTANGYASFIGGGMGNLADATNATVSGGRDNLALHEGATIGGGQFNRAGSDAVVGGGFGNHADGLRSTVAGGLLNNAGGDLSAIGGGESNEAIGKGSVIAGGLVNRIPNDSSDYSVIGGGRDNFVHAFSRYSAIAGGKFNRVSNDYATVAGGATNTASGYGSVIAGGANNSAAGTHASIGGGHSNRIETGFLAPLRGATIGGGEFNYIGNFGVYGTIAGGHSNEVLLPHGFAAGYRAKASHNGSFVWADETEADFFSTANNQFAVRANSGVMIQSTNTALDLRGGGSVRVQGAGVGTSTPVFIHRATVANTSGHITVIDHPHSNSDPNAILMVTPNYNPGGLGGTYNNSPIGVFYTAGKWTIFNQNTATPISLGAAFNVMVVKP